MKHLFFFLSVFGMLVPSSFVFAQENVPATAPPIPSIPGVEASGNVSCFDYYRFGSVSADLEPNLGQTVPGADIAFSGKVKNDNDYPLVNGTLYVKIFREDSSTFQEGNGNPVVDQFALPEKFTLPAKGERDASFTWHVPNNAPAGEYYAATFFATENRYNLLGLSFTDDVVGNMSHFTVTNPDGAPAAGFSKNQTTLNGQTNNYAAFPLKFGFSDPVEVKVKLTNPDPNPKVLQVVWMEYAWDALRPENERNRKYELVEVAGNESKELAYTVIPTNDAVSYLVAEARDGEAKTFLNIRFVREGVPETRINFPTVLRYPLKAGEANSLFACAHSTNEPSVSGNILRLTLRDDVGNVIHTYQYEGDISGVMGGWKDDFTPKAFLANFTLTATLEREGVVVEEVSIKYDCNEIDPNLCQASDQGLASKLSGKALAIGLIGGLSLLALAVVLFAKRRNRRNTQTFSIFLAGFLLAGGLFAGGAGVGEAKSVSWNQTDSGGGYVYTWTGAFGQAQTTVTADDTGPYKSNALGPATVTVTYTANVYNADTNALINDGASIPVGTRIRFTPKAYADADIFWNATGYSGDSPNGHWITNATPPAWSCSDQDFAGNATKDGYTFGVYAPLSVNPPANSISVSGTATLANQGGGVYRVDGAGSITGTVTFNATSGKFYYRYKELADRWFGDPLNGGMTFIAVGCYGNNIRLNRVTALISGTSDCAKYGYSCNATQAGTPYTLNVPAQTIPFTFTATAAANAAPATPTITGYTTGNPNVAYTFGVRAADSNGDTVRYGMDWDNNASVDEWLPASGYVASNTLQNDTYSWPTIGAKTFRAQAQDSKGATSGWATYTITLSNPSAVVNGACGAAHNFPASTRPTTGLCNAGTASAVAGTGPWTWTCTGSGGGTNASCNAPLQTSAPVVDLKINGSDGPLSVASGANLNLTWGSVSNATSCTASGTGWTGSKATSGGNNNVSASSASNYTLSCTGAGGTDTDSVSVTIVAANTLKVCENACNSGGNPSSYTMAQSATKNLVACWNPATGCQNTGGNVTASATWSEGGGNPISLSGSNPKVVTANNGGTESVSATYSGNTVSKSITVTCIPTVDCSNAPGQENYCQNETFDVDNGCGATITCNGTKSCNYNWKEVAP